MLSLCTAAITPPLTQTPAFKAWHLSPTRHTLAPASVDEASGGKVSSSIADSAGNVGAINTVGGIGITKGAWIGIGASAKISELHVCGFAEPNQSWDTR